MAKNSSNRNNHVFSIITAVAIIVVAVIVTLAITLPDNDKGGDGRKWVETFTGTYSFDHGVSEDMRADQLYLTRDNGSRLFVSKKASPFNITVVEIFDHTEGDPGGWVQHSRLGADSSILQQGISYIAPSLDGTRLAISDSENVTIYQETPDNSWVQVGETLTPRHVSGVVDPSMTYSFGGHAMSLSNDGSLLTVASIVSSATYNGTLEENGPFLVAVFREEDGRWRLVDAQKNFLVFSISDTKPVLASSGGIIASPEPFEQKDEWKEAVKIYEYAPASKWMPIETLVEPLDVVDDAPPMTGFGINPLSIALSYTGNDIAVGAANFKAGKHKYGRVEIYEKGVGGKRYVQKGQILEPSKDTYQLGSRLSFSSEGDRLAVFFTRNGQVYVQVYQYDPQTDLWAPLGGTITENVRSTVEYLSLSGDGSRVAIAWDCTPKELYCLSVYDLTAV